MFNFIKRLFQRKANSHKEAPGDHDEREGAVGDEGESSLMVLTRSVTRRLNHKLPVKIIEKSGNVLSRCIITAGDSNTLVLSRLPGDLTLPKFGAGDRLMLMAHTTDLDSVRVVGQVTESSITRCILNHWDTVDKTSMRSEVRLPVDSGFCTIIDKKPGRSERTYDCSIVDISLTGAHIVSSLKLGKGDVILLRFEILKDDGALTCRGQIVWDKCVTEGEYHYGVVFEEMSGWKRHELSISLDLLRQNLERRTKG